RLARLRHERRSHRRMIPTRRLAQLAADSYTCPASWRVGDVEGCIARIDGMSVVAFRGTEPLSIADWMRDLDAVPMRHPAIGWCHRGFLTGALAIIPLIRRDLGPEPLILTGHSLGGALALIV